MGRIYRVPMAFTSHSAAGDLIELIAPAGGLLKIHRVKLAQKNIEGDANADMIGISLKRATGSYTSGSGGTGVTPVPLDGSDVAASFTAELANTTDAAAGSGALTTVHSDAWHVAGGYDHLEEPEARPQCGVSEAFLLTLDDAPDAATQIGGFIDVEEFGT